MKKKFAATVLTAVLSLSMSTASFAAWHQNGYGWWYDNGDGTYPKGTWQWLDGNHDGTAECYCFNDIGYMYADTTTPDGYTVNKDGAWVVNGAVQVKSVSQTDVTVDRSVEGSYRSSATGENAVITVNEDGTIMVTAECNGYVAEHGPLTYIGDSWYSDRWGFSCIIKNNTLSFVADGEHIYQKQ